MAITSEVCVDAMVASFQFAWSLPKTYSHALPSFISIAVCYISKEES